MRVVDVEALASATHEVGGMLVVDATFATPLLFHGLELGADIVVHSATKYLGGHGDITGGVCVARDAALLERLRKVVITTGAVLSPFDAWLTLRGLRTLPLRMARHCHNALEVARFLSAHPAVANVYYPGLPADRYHALSTRQLTGGYGGMLAFDLKEGGRERAMAVLAALSLILPATTLGDTASLALYPAGSSHRGLSPEELSALGVGEGLLRLSVGIEHAGDITDDLNQALAR